MRLYAGSTKQFVDDTVHNQIAEKLKTAFSAQYRHLPSPSEVTSWRNSLRAMCDVVRDAELFNHGLMLEYQLPLNSKRIDCLICGKDSRRNDAAVIVELKQWERCRAADGENEVTTWMGGSFKDRLHPCVQVGRYRMYLEDGHSAFYAEPNPVSLSSCAYLHNYTADPDDELYSDKFTTAIAENPLFTADDFSELSDYLSTTLPLGDGLDTLRRIEQSECRPSKKLMDHLGNLVKGDSAFVLLDEQLVVYDRVLAIARQGFRDRRKTAVIVRGGPGTGKSVIALNLMADLLLAEYNVHYATGSKSFNATLKKIVGARGAVQFHLFGQYCGVERDSVDVLVCDEAHRIREYYVDRFRPNKKGRDVQVVDGIINAAKVSVFFIDDNQSVKPDEVGSSAMIKAHAAIAGCVVHEHELDVQFRCKGSEAFVGWIDNTLEVDRTPHILWNANEEFDFRILGSPQELENAILGKVSQGMTGRLAAGFCWPWTHAPLADGSLANDVVIGDFRRPWNAYYQAQGLRKGIPKADLWAHDPRGLGQVGCVYTAQGFEFDYVGVIIGNDLRYNLDKQQWEGHPESSYDRMVKSDQDQFLALVKKAYRVLLSRGLVGCYVCFLDKDTERFFKSRMELAKSPVTVAVEQVVRRLKMLALDDPSVRGREYREFLPVFSLRAAAGDFGSAETADMDGWLPIPDGVRPDERLFVAQVVGHSMEPMIPDGSMCIFRRDDAGSRSGKILLVEVSDFADPETGASRTVKRYSSRKYVGENDTDWRHESITLLPVNKSFKPIPLSPEQSESLVVRGELVRVLQVPVTQ
jgi:SOS-response transcriptional repressor LexA